MHHSDEDDKTAADMLAMDAFMTLFLDELHALCLESSSDVRGEVENALHQRLQSCGDKKKQALQLNAVAKGSSRYMDAVSSKFVKNFAKFDLYMRRNIVAVPDDLADEVEALYNRKRLQRNSTTSGEQGEEDTQFDTFADPTLPREEQQEQQLKRELQNLRHQLRELAERRQKLQFAHSALEKSAERFNSLTGEMEFLNQIPAQAVFQLKRAIDQVPVLHDSLRHIGAIQQTLEDETRAFKRAKTASRSNFAKLRERFIANSSAVSFASAKDLQALQVKLATL